MIKLNNKNITYVALADSNNSLKVPKEIWYADSSNSVKLVYRNYYERKEWLRGDGTAYLDTNIVPDAYTKWELDAIMKASSTTFQTNGIFFQVGSSYARFGIGIERNGRINMSCGLIDGITNVTSDNARHLFTLDAINSQWKIDNSSGTVDGYNYTSSQSIYIFARHAASSEKFFDSGNLIIYGSKLYANNTLIQHLVPCKLINALPASKDANGIARSIGECGMWDTVNDVFYGNVASSGTFSVSDNS